MVPGSHPVDRWPQENDDPYFLLAELADVPGGAVGKQIQCRDVPSSFCGARSRVELEVVIFVCDPHPIGDSEIIGKIKRFLVNPVVGGAIRPWKVDIRMLQESMIKGGSATFGRSHDEKIGVSGLHGQNCPFRRRGKFTAGGESSI